MATTKEKYPLIDVVLGVFFMIFGLIVYTATLDLPGSTYDPLGPAFMPRLLGILIAITAGVILYHGIYHHIKTKAAIVRISSESQKEGVSLPFKKHPLTALSAMILVFVYILAMDLGLSGFRTLTLIFVLLLGGMLIKAEKDGNVIKKSVFLFFLALLLSFGLFYLFTQVFIVDLY
ncbi:MAG: tripartite tricarboxylate transporter TctB family protein [Spirochaetales bacterium]|nr:tripartite tricarboxylate transporter TctB family protein [Spirochaetales bacterium]